MAELNITVNPNDIFQRTSEQAEFIKEILEEIQPAQCEFLGEDTITAVANGATFASIEEGNHLNFTELTSLLAVIAAISQLAAFIIIELKKMFNSPSEQLLIESKKIILQKVLEHPELRDLQDLITKDRVILDRILAAVIEKSRTLK